MPLANMVQCGDDRLGEECMAYKQLSLDAACAALQAGEVVAFSTETFYGLGCDALNPDAVGKVYAMKRRPYGLPLPVIIGDQDDLDRIVTEISPLTASLMDAFWPGPLSIILPASPEVPDLLTAGTRRIAVRFSPHPGCIALCRRARCVITASSANVSGNPPAASLEEIDPALGEGLAGVFDAPPVPRGGKPSTIVDIIQSGADEAARVLREGTISVAALQKTGVNVIVPDE